MSLVHKPEMTERNLAAWGILDSGLGRGACCQLSAVSCQLQKKRRFQPARMVAAHQYAFQGAKRGADP